MYLHSANPVRRLQLLVKPRLHLHSVNQLSRVLCSAGPLHSTRQLSPRPRSHNLRHNPHLYLGNHLNPHQFLDSHLSQRQHSVNLHSSHPLLRNPHNLRQPFPNPRSRLSGNHLSSSPDLVHSVGPEVVGSLRLHPSRQLSLRLPLQAVQLQTPHLVSLHLGLHPRSKAPLEPRHPRRNLRSEQASHPHSELLCLITPYPFLLCRRLYPLLVAVLLLLRR